MNKDTEKILNSIYYNTKKVGSYGGLNKLYKQARLKIPKITLKIVKDWLSGEIPYTLHKPARKKFKRNSILVSDIDEQWQADLVDMQEFSSQNSDYRYILTVIDIFSKFAYAIPLKDKRGETVTRAFEKIFKHRKPLKLQTDKGREFQNKYLLKILKKYNIQYFTSNDKIIKCAVIERFNRTLKTRMFKYFTAKGTRKYIDILDNLVESYNHSKHRTIKARPIDVTKDNKDIIFKNIYKFSNKREYLKNLQNSQKVNTGDHVRKRYILGPFDKSYYPLWSDQIYTIDNKSKGNKKSTYKITNQDASFYQEELQKIKSPIYRIEKIVNRRKINNRIEYFVKWLNHPNSDNSWIPASNVQNIS